VCVCERESVAQTKKCETRPLHPSFISPTPPPTPSRVSTCSLSLSLSLLLLSLSLWRCLCPYYVTFRPSARPPRPPDLSLPPSISLRKTWETELPSRSGGSCSKSRNSNSRSTRHANSKRPPSVRAARNERSEIRQEYCRSIPPLAGPAPLPTLACTCYFDATLTPDPPSSHRTVVLFRKCRVTSVDVHACESEGGVAGGVTL
jgi:hypothetical protein